MSARRPVPDDFVEVFLERGWDGLQYHYGTHNSTIARWVEEAGGDRLRMERAEIVRNRRSRAHVRSTMPEPVSDGIIVDTDTLHDAAHYLRRWFIVSPTGKGDWRVGTMRKTPAQVVDLAKAKGFETEVMVCRAQH